MSAAGGSQLVTIADIAEMAGTSRSAVSNWRKRYKDDDEFPTPVDTASSSPQFRLPEIEGWLRRHGRFRKRASLASAIWSVLERHRGRLNMDGLVDITLALITWRHIMRANGLLDNAVERTLANRDTDVIMRALHELPEREWEVEEVLRSLERAPEPLLLDLTDLLRGVSAAADELEAYEEVLDRQRKSLGRGAAESTTSPILVDILLELAQPTEGTVIYDGTIGIGTLALEAVRRAHGKAKVFGQEINDAAWRIAQQRFRLHDYSGDIRRGDTIAQDLHPEVKADIVISEPPFGLTGSPDERKAFGDPRWRFGPLARNLDLAWLQNAAFHLKPGGRAFVLTPMGPTFRGGIEARLRAEMLRAGIVEALVALPPGLAGRTGIPLALWVLCRPQESANPDRVLLVDGSKEAPDPRQLGELYREWRDSREITEEVNASEVPLLDLLGPEATLVPAQWIERLEDQVDPEELLSQLRDAIDLLQAQAQQFPTLTLPDGLRAQLTEESTHLVKLGDLADSGEVTIERAVMRLHNRELSETGTPAVTALNVRDPHAPTRFIADDVNDRVATKVGDVLLVVDGGLFARVETVGDRIPIGMVYVIRVHSSKLDPQYLAAVLASDWNKRHIASGTAMPRAKVRDLDVPAASAAAQDGLLTALVHLQTAEALAEDFSARIRNVRERMMEGELSGALSQSGGGPE